ncbi:hypothetical protein EDB86DRAFT_3086108 [Lactarius hatsudake]|nr:hypothetical protein EDB86DRAFT_3086108 [Lactarius hatsudake]
MIYIVLLHICTCSLGFISGKPYATIPWAKLSTTPAAWIQEECYPPGFQWADPSKIRLNDVHDLLIYWRQRKEDGLTPLIWNPSCELLADSDVEKSSGHLPARRRHQNDSTSGADDEEENYARELNNIADNSSILPLPPLPPSPHPVQTNPAGSDTEGLEQAGIVSTRFLEHPSVPQHSSSSNVEQSDNIPPSEPTPTEVIHNPHPHSLGKRQIKVTPKARNMDTGRGSERIGPSYLERNN